MGLLSIVWSRLDTVIKSLAAHERAMSSIARGDRILAVSGFNYRERAFQICFVVRMKGSISNARCLHSSLLMAGTVPKYI